MRMLRILTLAGMTLALTGAFGILDSRPNSQLQQVKQVIKRVSKKEFKEKLNTLNDVQLIDVRTPGEFKGGTIKGAINIDYNSSSFNALIAQLDKTKPTLIFCHSGGRSAKALQKFKLINFEYVLELEGGYSAWIK